MMGKKRGLFGAVNMGATAAPEMLQGVGDLAPVAQAISSQPINIVQPEIKSKPGFNDAGGWGEKLALIGSVLTGDGGNSPALQPFMLRRQMELQQQRAQQQRQAELEDYATKLRMKQQIDPDKPSQTSLQQNYDWLVSMGRKKEADDLIARMTSNVTWRQGPDGQFYPMQVQTPPSITDEDWNSAAPAGGGAGYGQQGFRP